MHARWLYFFFALLAAVAFNIVLFGLELLLCNRVFGLVPALVGFPMLCLLARSLACFREPLRFLSKISLSWRTKIPWRDLHLKYLVPLTNPSFLPKKKSELHKISRKVKRYWMNQSDRNQISLFAQYTVIYEWTFSQQICKTARHRQLTFQAHLNRV